LKEKKKKKKKEKIENFKLFPVPFAHNETDSSFRRCSAPRTHATARRKRENRLKKKKKKKKKKKIKRIKNVLAYKLKRKHPQRSNKIRDGQCSVSG
jgi:predicted metal-dependent hydrolase